MYIDQKEEILKLSMGGIAYLENLLGVATISQLSERFERQEVSSNDIIMVLKAGYFGANRKHIDIENVHIDGGVRKAATTALRLLKLAFDGSIYES